MPLKLKVVGLILLAMISITITAFIGVYIAKDANELNRIWQDYSEKEVKKSDALTEIIIGFGYGGFIHDFKNLILRQDQGYQLSSQGNLDRTYSGIENFLATENDPVIREKILIFKSTVDDYAEKLKQVNRMIEDGLSVKEIDNLVKVDDREAVVALETLLSSIRETTQNALNSSQIKMTDFDQLIRNGFIFIILCLIASAIVLAVSFNSIFTAYREISILFSSVPDAIIVTDNSGFISRVNKKSVELFGHSKNEFKSKTIEDLIPVRYREKHIKQRIAFQKSDRTIAMDDRSLSFIGLRKNGEEFPVNISVSSFHNNQGKHNIAVIKDISIEKKLEEEATKDHLTQIANRKKCFEFLTNSINQAKRYRNPLSVILCDIDFFKKINDTFGHNVGDEVLVEVSTLLKNNIRDTDLLARWGGEEFIIVCPNTTKNSAFIVAENLRYLIEDSFESSKTAVTISLGVTAFENDDDKHTLVERADAALYESKNQGRNQTTIR